MSSYISTTVPETHVVPGGAVWLELMLENSTAVVELSTVKPAGSAVGGVQRWGQSERG
jgi:hypothetical protein